MSHWEAAADWDNNNEDQDRQTDSTDILSGSYHCKSALRPFSSNMKLFMFKKSFNHLRTYVGSDPYSDDVLLLLPDIWNCFYNKTTGLDREACAYTSRVHSTGSPAFSRWSDYIQNNILQSETVEEVLLHECHIFKMTKKDVSLIAMKINCVLRELLNRLLYIIHFFHLILIVVNYRYNPKRPDITCKLPGVITDMGEDIYRVKYNDFLYVDIYKEAVRVKTPCYDQIVQKDFILNISDKLTERFNVVLGSHLISALSRENWVTYQDDTSLPHTIDNIITWGDNLLYSKRNVAFDLIGKYEAYCVSSILKDDDPSLWDNMEFQTNLLTDDLENNPQLYHDAVDLVGIFNRLTPMVLSEVHGMWRIWGHPIIDIEGGMKKMEATSTKRSNIDNEETAIGVRTFKLTFFQNYLKKHKHYPLCNLTDKRYFNLYLQHLSDKDRDAYDRHSRKYNSLSYIHSKIRSDKPIDNLAAGYVHEDWDDVIPLQNFQIPQSMNLATMIKDKAISQTRQELIQSVQLRNSVFDSTKRRGVLKWLSEQAARLRDYLMNIDENGLDENDRIIGLYPKERELKTKARFFSLMSYNMRMYVTATEEILSKYLLPYFPMITMSDTLLNMIIRLYNMTTNIGRNKTKVVYSMNIDFSKWNQNMREKTNDGIFKSIDRIIGFRSLISRTHDIFRRSYLYLCSGEYIPTIIRGTLTTEAPYSRIGDESGKEGLRQKGWTITTVCDILSLAFKHKVKIELIGGGDNQVLTVEIRSLGNNRTLPEAQQLEKIKERMIRFRNALAKKMEKRGLPLKLEETWISHRLLMYNKIMYRDGVPLPGRLKVISRIFANANEGICTLGSVASTLGTGFQSISSKDYTPIFAWIASRYLTFIQISIYYSANPLSGTRRLDQQILKSQHNMREGVPYFGEEGNQEITNRRARVLTMDKTLSVTEMYIILIYYHKVLGGPGIGPPTSYIMKGFPDPLSEALSFNYSILEQYKLSRSNLGQMVENLTRIQGSRVKHWEHLLEDPVSVNHDAPSHGIAALRMQAETVMKNATIQNIQFKELIKLGQPEYLKELSESLCSADVLEPRLLHDIVGSTVPGYVNTILSKVDQSTTLSKLSADVDILYEVYCTEIKYYIYLASKVKVKNGHEFSPCPTSDARRLRNSTWGKTIVGVTTPHPLAYLAPYKHPNTSPECDQNYISSLIKRGYHYGTATRGPFRPYFGSYTEEKFKMNVMASAYGEEDVLRRAMKIQKLLGWRFKIGTRAYKLIQMILTCVTNADPNKFLPIPEEITGDVEHRYKDMATKHGGIPTNLIRDYTTISCNTSTFIDHSKGAANETLHFQAAIIYCSMVSNLLTIEYPRCTSVIHFHEGCKLCIAQTSKTTEDIPDDIDLQLMSCPTNDLMYIEEQDIPVHYHNQMAFISSQERRELQGGDIAYHDMEEKADRASWLTLFISSVFNERNQIKRSALKLHIESCNINELILVLKSFIALWMLKKEKPWTLSSECDLQDITIAYHEVINLILTSRNMKLYMLENNIITKERSDNANVMKLLLEGHENNGLYRLRNSYCKFQEPEGSICKKLILLARAPSTSTCYNCIYYILSLCGGNGTVVCNQHGEIPSIMLYHLYSLDKLSRNKGFSLEEEDRKAETTSKKRKLDLFAAMYNNKMRKLNIQKDTRARSFLLDESLSWTNVLPHVTHQMVKFKITSTAGNDGDNLTQNVSKCYNKDICNINKRFSFTAHYILCTIGAILLSVRHRNLTGDGPSMVCTIGIDINDNLQDVVIWKKVFSCLSSWANMMDIEITIRLLCSRVINLEDMDGFNFEELITRTRGIIDNKSFIIQATGDGAIDIVSESQSCFCIVTSNPLVTIMSDCPVFLMSRSDTVYEEISSILSLPGYKPNHQMTLIHPTISINNPMSVLIRVEPESNTPHHVSESKLLRATDDSDVVYDYHIHAILYDSISQEGGTLLSALLNETIEQKVPIMSERDFIHYKNKITSAIRFLSLQMGVGDMMPWRLMLLIKIMIGIIILTSHDRIHATSYFSEFSSVAFKGTNFRRLILYKENRKPKCKITERKGELYNWTNGGIGKGILSLLGSLEESILIEHKMDHILSPIIDL